MNVTGERTTIRGIPNDTIIHDRKFIKCIADHTGIMNFSLDSIDSCYRLKVGENTKSLRPIVVRFLNLSKKREFFGHYLKQIKNGNLSIKLLNENYPASAMYINEHLDKITSGLFFAARQLKKSNKINKVSILNNFVVIKCNPQDKPLYIKSMDDLDRFK